MSTEAVIWAGTEAGLGEALKGMEGADIKLLLRGYVAREHIQKWCGISAPPEWATHVIYQAPTEADGSATWREYRDDSNARIAAPEVDVIFARIATRSS